MQSSGDVLRIHSEEVEKVPPSERLDEVEQIQVKIKVFENICVARILSISFLGLLNFFLIVHYFFKTFIV